MVNRHILQSRRNSLMAMSAVVGFEEYATVETVRFTEDTLHGLAQVMRFYSCCERLRLEVHHSQTKLFNGVARMQQKWRYILREIVNEFFRNVERMHSCNSFVELVCKNKRDLLDCKSAWEWITDDDMIIFEKCYNLMMSNTDEPSKSPSKSLSRKPQQNASSIVSAAVTAVLPASAIRPL